MNNIQHNVLKIPRAEVITPATAKRRLVWEERPISPNINPGTVAASDQNPRSVESSSPGTPRTRDKSAIPLAGVTIVPDFGAFGSCCFITPSLVGLIAYDRLRRIIQ